MKLALRNNEEIKDFVQRQNVENFPRETSEIVLDSESNTCSEEIKDFVQCQHVENCASEAFEMVIDSGNNEEGETIRETIRVEVQNWTSSDSDEVEKEEDIVQVENLWL